MEFLPFRFAGIRVEVVAMSPSSRSKSKDKKAGKEIPKGSSKPSGHISTNGGIPASGYNPLLGTFHTFEASSVPSASPLHGSGRFRNIDDTDDHNGNSNGVEYDSVSNNGSWSGESEDLKEKASQPPSRQESVPGADNDKREKVRQKNERKHQRQKERRAQELHERCSGYLMSRKLEALAHQLVAMGFNQERATMALILNEGRVEESVAWLFEGGEDDKRMEHNLGGSGNLKIDISEELVWVTDMEIRYKASKQEVERAVVFCEGDLEKAEEILKAQKQDPAAGLPKTEEIGDPPIVASGKLPMATNQNVTRVQTKATSSGTIQQKRDDRDFNYTKGPATVGPSADPKVKKIPPKLEWAKPQQSNVHADKRWPGSGSNPSSVSSSSASRLQASLAPEKTEARYLAVGNELKSLQLGSVREPVIVMQRPQSVNAKQVPSSCVSSSPPGGTNMGWFPSSGGDTVTLPNASVPPVTVPRSLSPNDVNPNQSYNQFHYQSQQQFMPNSSSVDSQGTATRGISLWSRDGASPTRYAASSLGLFSAISGSGSSGSLSPVDWNTGGSVVQLDYMNIDWSLDTSSVLPGRNGLWGGSSSSYSLQNNVGTYDSFAAYGLGVTSAINSGGSILGFQEGVASTEPAGGGPSREWTSPFEERDMFSLPRQFVSSPSL